MDINPASEARRDCEKVSKIFNIKEKGKQSKNEI